MKLSQIFLCGVIVAAALFAEPSQAERLSRGEAIARALRQNPQIAAARSRRAQAEAEQEQADSARWPEVTVELGIGPALRAELVPGTAVGSTKSRYDVTFDDLSFAFGGRVSVLQPLYTFGKIDSTREAARHGVRAREAQTQITRAEVAVDVARLYEGLLLARDTGRFFEEIANYILRTITATEQRLASGVPEVNEQDVLRLQTALGAARLALHHSQAAQAQATAGLVAYLGMSPDAVIEPQEDHLLPLAGLQMVARRLVTDALRHRPELIALEQGALAHDALAQAERAGYFPDLFVLAFATGAYTPGRDLVESRYVVDPLYHFDPGLLLGLRWQVQGGMAAGRTDERRAQADELRHVKSWALAGLPAQVKKAYEDLERARRDMQEARTAVDRAKKWMVRATADYAIGMVDSQPVVDATRAYAELRAAELDAIFRHNVARAELAHATGTIVNGTLGLYPTKESK